MPAVEVVLGITVLLMPWVALSVVEMDRVDATGEAGSAFSEVGRLVGAVAAAVAASLLVVRPRDVRA
ncbi:hypothetical protein [Geodermatophilus chilensis]|uniref:hypothetical protein n=1 Tax=Geodermatophilus chilensis TaxID=2035835 RepID=UPI000C257C9E|nr:hypothetical protein [Geodermatophilus chilensis]